MYTIAFCTTIKMTKLLAYITWRTERHLERYPRKSPEHSQRQAGPCLPYCSPFLRRMSAHGAAYKRGLLLRRHPQAILFTSLLTHFLNSSSLQLRHLACLRGKGNHLSLSIFTNLLVKPRLSFGVSKPSNITYFSLSFFELHFFFCIC